MIASIDGISSLRAGAAWSPVLVILDEATMTPTDLDLVLGVPGAALTVLAGDGTTVVQAVDGSAMTRQAVGRYAVTLDPLPSSGVYFLRVAFIVANVEYLDPVRIMAGPPVTVDAGLVGTAGSLARVYTYPGSLLSAGFDLGDLTPLQVWDAIRDVSAEIEAITKGNIFNGEPGDYACSGRARRVVYHPLQLPFCHLERVSLSQDRTDHLRDGMYRITMSSWQDPVVDEDRYTLRAGMVESIRASFPMGVGNVVVRGAVGTLAPAHHVETTSVTEVGPLSGSVQIADLTGFQPRDVVDVVGVAGAVRVVVKAVDVGTSSLVFDPLGGAFEPVEAGAVVRTYGAVPRQVELVANYLFGVRQREVRANAAGEEFLPAGRIKRERTDDYEIEFQPGSASDSLTGSPKYDQMLIPYLKPIDVRVP